MLESINQWLIQIIDIALAAWPSTPPQYKLSAAIAKLILEFPAAPWYLIGKFIDYATWVFGVVAAIKAWKLAPFT